MPNIINGKEDTRVQSYGVCFAHPSPTSFTATNDLNQ